MGIYRMRTEFGQHLKIVMGIIAAIFIVGAVFSFGGAPNRTDAGDSNDVVAKVNGLEIPRTEFMAAFLKASEESRQGGSNSVLAQANIKAMVLQNLVTSRMLLKIAEDMDINISDSKVEEEQDKYLLNFLKQNRKTILGSVSKEREAIDPREDREYLSKLAEVNMSIDSQIEQAKALFPVEQVRTMLAAQGIQDKLMEQSKSITDKDIDDSYNVYSVRQIFLPKGAGTDEQNAAKAKKIVDELKNGGDFGKLAKANSQGFFGNDGKPVEMTLETSFLFPKEVREAVAKLQPGAVSEPIATSAGTFIIKLESVTNRKPAKFAEADKKKRTQQILDVRKNEAQLEMRQKLMDYSGVEVIDPELKGYWHAYIAQTSMDPKQREADLKIAIASLEAAIKSPKSVASLAPARAMLAKLYMESGKKADAIKLLEATLNDSESADLLIMLGDLYMDTKQADKAVVSYSKASEQARNDVSTREMLLQRFKKAGKADLAAAETKEIEKAKENVRLFQESQKRNMPSPAAPAPTKAQ